MDKRNRSQGNSGRCTKQSSKKRYSKKRRNKNKGKKLTPLIVQTPVEELVVAAQEMTTPEETNQLQTDDDKAGEPATASNNKVEAIESPKDTVLPTGFRFIDLSVLSDIFSLMACPNCLRSKTCQLLDIQEKKKGFARFMQVKCIECEFEHSFYTSPQISSSKDDRCRGMKTMEINVRAVYAFRSIGVGYMPLTKLCGLLNMPAPMTKTGYEGLSNSIKVASKEVAEKSMSDAAAKLRGTKETADIGVSVDGTWQRKGFSSTLGVVTAISVDSGEVLDVAIMSKSCKGCTAMKKIASTDPARYQTWKLSHKCNLNYTGSSPAMETAGATKIFSGSKEKHNLFYTSFYGDGDSKAYPAVKDIYGPTKPVKKYECIGHYQKRVGTRLRKLKKDNKGLGGRGKLTDAKIDTLQNYFGIALRSNTGNLAAMKSNCMASMYHICGYHDDCPKSYDTWCQYQKG